MDDEIALLAARAGLDRAWTMFPRDVTDAVTSAAGLRAAFDHPADPAEEPTPAMRVDEV